MKWLCTRCKAINPEFSFQCHSCGYKPLPSLNFILLQVVIKDY